MPTPFRHWLRPSTPAKPAPKACLRVESLEARDVPATFTVTTTADGGAGSLRQAILDANSTAGADTIAFALGSGPATISPLSNLPQVTDAVTIDGWSQPGFAGTPIVELSGASAGNAWGLIVGATATVRGLVVNRFTYDAIHVEGAGSVGTRVQGCYLGTDVTGTSASPNGYAGVAVWPGTTGTVIGTDGDGVNDPAEGNLILSGVWVSGPGTQNTVIAGNRIGTNAAGTAALPTSNGDGVYVRNGATGTRIGTNGDGVADALETNVISGNKYSGVVVIDGGTDGTLIAGNRIGTNAAGTAAIGNGYAGVVVYGGPTGTVVGTNGDGVGDAAEGNVISGNAHEGIWNVGASGTVIAGNSIGTNAAGTAALPNAYLGIDVHGGSVGVRIGTNGDGVSDAAEGNLISGNAGAGVVIYDAATSLTVVAGNRIGTNAAGSAALANGYEGVVLFGGAADTRIGTNGDGVSDALERNVLSGNAREGVKMLGGALRTVIAGNSIGTDAAGAVAIPNGFAGVYVADGAVNTVIGTNGDGVGDAAEGNVLSGNVYEGVALDGTATTGTVIAGNRIGTNAAGTAALGNGLTTSAAGISVRSGAKSTRVGTNGDGVSDALERNVISGNGGDGVQVSDGNTAGTVIAGNYVGTNATGTGAVGNGVHGVQLRAGSTGTVVGGGKLAARNVISGNLYGLSINDAGTNNNVVAGNFVGTNANGTASLGGNNVGVYLGGSSNNRVGTDGDGVNDDGERNVISGNSNGGVFVVGGTATGNLVAGNFIGTNAAGTGALGNADDGVRVTGGAANTLVLGNVVSGSTGGDGIEVSSAGAGTVLRGNLVGLNATGTAGLGNRRTGIYVANTSGVTVGGPNLADRNVVAASVLFIGIHFDGSGNGLIQNNYVGTNAAGNAALPNLGEAGVLVNGASADTRVIGNLVSGNSGVGVLVRNAGATGTVIAGNFIGTNAAGTAALANRGNAGVVVSGAADTRVGTNGDGVGDTAERNVISGNTQEGIQIEGGAARTVVAGNFIGTDAAGATKLANGYAGVLIWDGAVNTRVGTNGDGSGDTAERNVVSGNGYEGVRVSAAGTTGTVIAGNFVGTNALGTAAIGNTNAGVALFGGGKNTVVGTNGDGVGDAAEGNLISGNLREGVFVADATTTGTVIAGNRVGTNAAGTAALGNTYGLYIAGGARNTRVGTNADGVSDALERNVISGNGADGVQVADVGTTGTVIAGNFIGTNAAGDAAIGNLGVGGGVYVRNGASNTTVGGTAAAAGNVLSGNSGVNGDGVEIELSSGNFVYGNRIGTDATGTFAIPNRQNGVNLDRATGNFVGGPAPGAGNLISGNTRTGVLLGGVSSTTTANTVQGNRIGTDATGTAALPNLEEGVLLLTGAGGNTVGTNGDGVTDAAEGNVIAFNGRQGVSASGASVSGNAFRGNSVFGNAGLGIDLNGDGVTANDPLDADAGANGSQNFPLLTARTGFATRVAGLVPSRPSTTYLVDFYANPAGTAQGARYLGTVSVTTDAAGNGHFDATLAALTAAGEAVTATATDPAGNTSEFSAAATPPLSVESVVVNRGQAQRSMVTRIDVTFSGVLPAVDATAFALTQVGGPAVGLVVASATVGGKTVVTVTFTGPGVSAGSLADGNYTFTIDGAKLLDPAGRRVDADGDGLAGGTGATSLFRLFGDSDGDRDVDNADFFRLRTALLNPGLYATYAYFDFNGDGVITAADRAAFDARRGTILLP